MYKKLVFESRKSGSFRTVARHTRACLHEAIQSEFLCIADKLSCYYFAKKANLFLMGIFEKNIFTEYSARDFV
jgi:hypothetical protein